MCPLPLLNEGELGLVVRYSLDGDEDMCGAVVTALQIAGVDVYDRPTRLADWIDVDVVEHLQWTADRPLYLSTRLWDHRVVMTPGEVRVYNTPASGEGIRPTSRSREKLSTRAGRDH